MLKMLDMGHVCVCMIQMEVTVPEMKTALDAMSGKLDTFREKAARLRNSPRSYQKLNTKGNCHWGSSSVKSQPSMCVSPHTHSVSLLLLHFSIRTFEQFAH